MDLRAAQDFGLFHVPAIHCEGLNQKAGQINHGFNSGFQVINLAYQMGAGRIICIDKSNYRLDIAKKLGADVVINADVTSAEERLELIRSMTRGLGADVVLHMTNRPQPVIEGIEMLRRGGTLLEMGNFADTGEVAINIHRHICSKNIRLIGLTNHPIIGYGPSLRLFEKYADFVPFADIVTHEYGLADADAAMRTSMSPESGKVVINPWMS